MKDFLLKYWKLIAGAVVATAIAVFAISRSTSRENAVVESDNRTNADNNREVESHVAAAVEVQKVVEEKIEHLNDTKPITVKPADSIDDAVNDWNNRG